MGRTEADRSITSEPKSSRLTSKTTHEAGEKTLLSDGRSLLKKCLTGPTLSELLEMLEMYRMYGLKKEIDLNFLARRELRQMENCLQSVPSRFGCSKHLLREREVDSRHCGSHTLSALILSRGEH
jgi:hypothetical protein